MNTDLRLVADRVVPVSRYYIVVDGETCSLPTGLSFKERRDRLADKLYRELYIRPVGRAGRAASLADVNDFQATVLGATSTRMVWQPGWKVVSMLPEGGVMVAKNGIAFHAPLGEVELGVVPAPDSACTVRVPAAYLGTSPGFLLFIGENDLPAETALSRFYWHLKPEIACDFAAAATEALNASSIPFRLKLVSNPDDYVRADAGVIYIARRNLAAASAVVERVYSAVADGLRSSTPLFARRLAPGLAAADDPGNGLSFGQAVCSLVAEAVLGMPIREAKVVAARRAAIAAAFHEHGLDHRRPHLAEVGGGRKDYQPLRVPARRHPPGSPHTSGADRFLQVADEIGRLLCARAVWSVDGDRCNWLMRVNGIAERDGLAQATLAPLRFDFYEGLAGVALFFAELFRQTGTEMFRKAAVGSIGAACAQMIAAGYDGVQPGFHTGLTGLCQVARRVRALTGYVEGDALVEQMLSFMAALGASPAEDDLIDGKAGVILALLGLQAEMAEAGPYDWAVALGHELSAAIDAMGDTKKAFAATGLAHGGAGMGLALFELHAWTSSPRFLAAARRIFAIEDRFYDTDAGNWSDPQLEARSGTARLPIAWCRGAPGIALTRLRASTIDTACAEAYRERAAAALATSARELRRLMLLERFDATLCHGAGGLIDIMLTAALLTGDRSLQRKTRDCAHRFVDRRADWLSGHVAGTANPTLMLGSAGIGLLCLRLHDPKGVASPLSPWPATMRAATFTPPRQ